MVLRIRTLARAPVRRTPRGEMNGLERRYAALLQDRKNRGEIHDYWFESMTLKLAPDCRYTPDFVVQLIDGTIELHECKGFWRDDARVKIKLAADKFPYRCVAAAWTKKTGWTFEDF